MSTDCSIRSNHAEPNSPFTVRYFHSALR